MSEEKTRKATDVILSLENKIDILLAINQSQDLNIKLLSNKLNSLIEKVEKLEFKEQNILQPNYQKPKSMGAKIEAVDDFPLMKDFKIQVNENSVSSRRGNRSPNEEVQDYLNSKKQEPQEELLWDPNRPKKPSIPPAPESVKFVEVAPAKITTDRGEEINNSLSKVPVIQRIVDKKNNKSVFMAEVEIKDLENKLIYKTKTSGTGKWEASILPGEYRVFIKKSSKNANNTIDRLEVVQDLTISPSNYTQELKNLEI